MQTLHRIIPLNRHTSKAVLSLFACLAVSLCTVATAALSPRVVITPVGDFTITWDGNNGGFYSPAAGAGPAENIALATSGTVAFGSTEFDGGGAHLIANVNDGLYGNSHSWIPNFLLPDSNPFIGLRFGGATSISSIAWSRDNGNTTEGGCAGGTCVDRCVGVYTLQYTTVDMPDASTPETGDSTTGWADIGTVEYLPGADDINFSAYLRHRFDLAQGGAPIVATGIRIKVPDTNVDIDEIEVNPEPDPSFLEITSAPGYTVFWDGNEGKFSTQDSPAPAPVNDASPTRGAVAFGSSEFGGGGSHLIANVSDGLYGNNHSWIANFTLPDTDPFIGIKFAEPLVLQTIAWGRDNGDGSDPCAGACMDRTLGVYTLQITTVPEPGVDTPEACGPFPGLGWVTVATLNYKGDSPVFFNSYLRHRFNLAQGGQPLVATGIRIKVPDNGICIDEIEVNANSAFEAGALVTTPAPGIEIGWDGNDGQFWNAAVGAAPPANRALVSEGTVAFASSELGAVLGIDWHRALNVNDGLYGNNKSWISANGIGGSTDPDPFVGLSFGGMVQITNIAWSRDNGNTAADDCGGTCVDRCAGTYTLQYTMIEAPDASTLDTGDAATGWAPIGTISYGAPAAGFTPYLRHRFEISAGALPVEATGIRIKVSDGWTAIDEIEVNTAATPPAPAPALVITPAEGYTIAWDGNQGEFYDASQQPIVAPNRALATEGTVPFTSSDLGTVWPTNYHLPFNLNDGLYGNSNSWISGNGFGGGTDPDPFAGLNFNGTVLITNIAWSRDNGALTDGCIAGTCVDRCLGTYTIQVTTVPAPDGTTTQTDDPATGWATIGTVTYNAANPPQFTPYLRHRFDVSAGGQPIEATGLRIKVSDGLTAIDEMEVNTLIGPQLKMTRSENDVVLTWVGSGALEYATSVDGPWTCIPGAISGHRETIDPGQMRIYRLHR